MQLPFSTGSALNPQVWVDLVLVRFRSVPFYLVALLLHLLFFIIFGTLEITSPTQGVITAFNAPAPAQPAGGQVAPPPPPPAEKQDKLVKTTTAPASTARPTMISTPLPNAAVQIPTPVVAPAVVQSSDLAKNLSKSLSNVKVAGTYQSRMTGGARGNARSMYGGTEKGEGAVLRALQWLKQNQNEDGSWGGSYKPTMTGLALLTFLAHGETQGSQAYGATVQKGVQYLMDIGRKNKGKLATQHVEYQHAIATYALSEDYALTQISDLLTVLEGSVGLIVTSQAPNGSWDYGYNNKGREDPSRPGGDTSISGWNIQALKAAKNAGVHAEGLDSCAQKALGFLRNVYDEKSHHFGYGTKGGGSPALLGVGVLCMNFLGAGDAKEVRGAMGAARDIKCDWSKGTEASSYMWYYLTQAMFQSGGSYWVSWNREFRDEIIKHQAADGHWPVPGTSADSLGAAAAGSWRQVPDPKDQPVYHTTLLCMMLEVYYRFLPTFK